MTSLLFAASEAWTWPAGFARSASHIRYFLGEWETPGYRTCSRPVEEAGEILHAIV
ncbi:MAG: hypothetical protein KF693_00670 [Nitrospira sp.]|nr:hypothetical protein [Nitrospira sp.]